MPFETAKLLSVFLDPLNVLVLALALGFCAVLFLRPGAVRGFFLGLGVLATLFLCATVFFPIGAWALFPLENRFSHETLPPAVEGIVVLTGDENPRISETRDVPVAGHAASRYLYLARLAKLYPNAKIVLSGTTVPLYRSHFMTTRAVSEALLKGVDVAPSRIVYEERSRNTHENATFSYAFVKPKEGARWLLVTSAFHMPRAVLCFRAAGWSIAPAPADYFTASSLGGESPDIRFSASRQMRLLATAAHEYFGLLVYALMGRTESVWP